MALNLQENQITVLQERKTLQRRLSIRGLLLLLTITLGNYDV